ncbi:LysE family transporter [Streptomyces sp. KLOTTS4A1]|uniref:LysE family transporter n=1 Tax=Streptomyces sp. KLOTTS4A1 TaxID=3390996 RepID=UPI0039F5E155
MTAALVAGLFAGYGIAVPVGAVATYLVALTARTSLRTGAAGALGVASADGLYALTAVVGGTALAPLLASAASLLRWVSVVVLLALAVRGSVTAIRHHRTTAPACGAAREPTSPTALGPATDLTDLTDPTIPTNPTIPTAPTGPTAPTDHTALRTYATLLGITLLNPVTVVYFTALVLGPGPGSPAGAVQRTVFVLAAFTASASWQLLLAGGGALLGRALTGRRGRLLTALGSSALMAGLAVATVAA